jgi:LCP family protein required for cell wall assembly
MLFPGRTTVLVLGIDARPDEGVLGRSDTNVIATFDPIQPYVGALSIPRDLWVTFEDGSQNRINTAHFFAEANQEGSGPKESIKAFEYVFGLPIDYYVRLRFSGFADIVDAMGGLDVTFDRDMSGYTTGTHHLDGTGTLALVRDRAGSDDFARMERAQLFFKSAVKQMLKPLSWPRIPLVYAAVMKAVDTNIPIWQYPRLAMAVLRTGADGIDSRTIDRSMATGWITEQGANVLLPNWDLINPMLMEMFGY